MCEALQFLDIMCGSTTGGLGLLGLYINEDNVGLVIQTLETLTVLSGALPREPGEPWQPRVVTRTRARAGRLGRGRAKPLELSRVLRGPGPVSSHPCLPPRPACVTPRVQWHRHHHGACSQ